MGTTSTVNGLPAPAGGDGNDVASHLLALVAVLDTGSVVKRLTSAQIAALTSAQKPAGLVVYNTTTGRLQVSNGSTFDDYVRRNSYADYTPTITQDAESSIAKTVGVSRWVQIGSQVHFYGSVTITASGDSGWPRVSLPVSASSHEAPVGDMRFYDASAGQAYTQGMAWLSGGDKVYLVPAGGGAISLANGDYLQWCLTDEAA